MGVAAEMGLLYLALPVVQGDGRWSLRLPNAFNYGFEYSIFLQVCGRGETLGEGGRGGERGEGDGRWSLRLPNAFNHGFEYFLAGA